MTVELDRLNMTITTSADDRNALPRRAVGPQASANPNADEDMIKLALSSIAIGSWMQNAEIQVSETVSANELTSNELTSNELTSLSALIAYVADQSGENEFRVERRLADRFNVPSVKRLPANAFDSAIRYLVDGI